MLRARGEMYIATGLGLMYIMERNDLPARAFQSGFPNQNRLERKPVGRMKFRILFEMDVSFRLF